MQTARGQLIHRVSLSQGCTPAYRVTSPAESNARTAPPRIDYALDIRRHA